MHRRRPSMYSRLERDCLEPPELSEDVHRRGSRGTFNGSGTTCWRRVPEWLPRRRSGTLAPASTRSRRSPRTGRRLSRALVSHNRKDRMNTRVLRCTNVAALQRLSGPFVLSGLHGVVRPRSPPHDSPALRRACLAQEPMFLWSWGGYKLSFAVNAARLKLHHSTHAAS
jgi:hypothetical protein